MPAAPSAVDHPPVLPVRAKAEIEYHIEGRILRTVATGPFQDELVAAIPLTIRDMLIKLVQQGKWGQIVTFQKDASASQAVLDEFASHLKSRYLHPETRPVTALVFGHNLKGGQEMAPEFCKCYAAAGVECVVFEDYSTAQYWVKSKIRQTSKLVEWNDSYKIGDTAIDEQHQELFLRAADVIAATNRESQTMGALRLYQYTRSHFSHEESLMEHIDYPEISSHMAHHKDLLAKLNAFLHNISKDNLVKAELEDFISHWFLGHIAHVDAKLAAYLKN